MTMQHIISLALAAAPTGARVLITGPSGTGKSRLARTIHEASGRKGPLVVCDCGALPEGLAESVLFGHVRGSFSGAMRDHVGYFEEAHGGTLLLDEVGDLPLSLQPRLLRVLQDGVIRRVGGGKDVRVDVRVIAATCQDLRGMVARGKFREDLYYRLAGLALEMPPLKARRREIPGVLAGVKGLTAEAAGALAGSDHAWPGNLRELVNVAELAAHLGWGAAEVEAHLSASSGVKVEAASRREVVMGMAEAAGEVTTGAVAQRLGVLVPAASRLLRRMVEDGLLTRAGRGAFCLCVGVK